MTLFCIKKFICVTKTPMIEHIYFITFFFDTCVADFQWIPRKSSEKEKLILNFEVDLFYISNSLQLITNSVK